MTELIANRLELNRGVVACVATTGKLVDLCVTPDGIALDVHGQLIDPYAIVYPLPGVPSYPALDDSWCTSLQYQITCVGQNADQAQWMADKTRHALTSRNPATGGNWTNPITASDALVIDRRLREEGGPEPTGDGGLWQVVDTYDLEVQAQ
jgi:hypothetical protein